MTAPTHEAMVRMLGNTEGLDVLEREDGAILTRFDVDEDESRFRIVVREGDGWAVYVDDDDRSLRLVTDYGPDVMHECTDWANFA